MVLHGIWPRNLSVKTGHYVTTDKRLSMKSLSANEVQEMSAHMNLVIADYPQLLNNFSKKGNFYVREYQKHWYKNGYSFDFI